MRLDHLWRSLLILPILAVGSPAAAVPPFSAIAARSVEPGALGPGGVSLAGHPDGGWLLLGNDPEDAGRLKAIRIAADGTPAGAVVTEVLNEVEVTVLEVAVTSSGNWVAAWSGEVSDYEFSHPNAGLFEPDGTLVRELDLAVPEEKFPTRRREVVVAPAPDGGFVVAWGARTAETQPADGDVSFAADLFAARFSQAGERLAGPVLVNEQRVGFQVPTAIAIGPTAVAVSWNSWCCEPPASWDTRARALAPDLSPLSGEVPVNEDEHRGLDQFGEVLAVDAAGRFTVRWRDWRSTPEGEAPSQVILFRRFEADGTPIGPANAAPMDWTGLRGPAGVATPLGVVWMAWVVGTFGEAWVRPFSFDGAPLGPAVRTGFFWESDSGEIVLAADPAGRVLMITYGWPKPVTGVVLGGEAPPPEHALASPEVPGFRVWVLITDPSGASRWGAEEPACLPETLCASGALPGRTEALVRMVGPKPNGFLWPTLVKLSTSRVEVWIEQESTGVIRHYVLPGASPGNDTLPGLFDRHGFHPD